VIDKSLIDIKKYFSDKFPKNYINDVKGWGISKEKLHSKLLDGTHKLLTLDLDFGSDCSLYCPHCFRKSNALDTTSTELSFKETLNILKQAKELGLESIKILGAGEPFENPQFISFLSAVRNMNVDVAIFTKGHVLGSDQLANNFFGEYGIKSSEELVKFINNLEVSILLGFNSFHPNIQEDFVGLNRKKWKFKENFVSLRNQALHKLAKYGFNKYIEGQPTRLALIAAPIKPINIDEIFEIYRFGRRRNMYVVSCPTTYSGLGKIEFEKENRDYDFSWIIEKLKQLYTKIYIWNIEQNLMSLDQLKEEGVSLYPGAHPCNQVAAGMYITLKGKVIRCPGRDENGAEICHDVRRKPLKEIWVNSSNYQLAKQDKFNYHCIARDGIFFTPRDRFYEDVFKRVLNGIKDGK